MIPNYGMYPQQQQRLNYLESQMATQQNLLRGRPVASLDEVRAIPIFSPIFIQTLQKEFCEMYK